MLKAIFFDLDDTLLDAQTPYLEAIAATCAEAGRRCVGLDPGYHLGIITNGMTEIQREKIQRLGIEPYFDTILISQEVGITKPDPRIFRMAIERVPCEAREAVMIGDSPDRDIAGARAAGLIAVWVRTGWRKDLTPGSSDNEAAHAILDRLEEL